MSLTVAIWKARFVNLLTCKKMCKLEGPMVGLRIFSILQARDPSSVAPLTHKEAPRGVFVQAIHYPEANGKVKFSFLFYFHHGLLV